jgi:ligand-binding sensor domain-containing protein
LATFKGLYSLDPSVGSIRHYSHNPNDPLSLSNDEVKLSGEDKEGRFWVATSGHLDEFDRRTGKVVRDIPIPGAPLGFGFYENRFGAFWIFHDSPNALSVLDRKTNTLTNYSFHELAPTTAALTVIMAMTEDRSGALWLATHGAGLLKFDREHRRLIRYRYNPGAPESLPQNNIENLFADREGNIWAGLGRMGVTHFASTLCRLREFPVSPVRMVQLNPLLAQYTRTDRESCGSVHPLHSTILTARPGATLLTVGGPDLPPVPM